MKEKCTSCGKISKACVKRNGFLLCGSCVRSAYADAPTLGGDHGVSLHTIRAMVIEIPRGPHITRQSAIELLSNGSCGD